MFLRTRSIDFQAPVGDYHTVIMSCAIPNWEGTESDNSDRTHFHTNFSSQSHWSWLFQTNRH